MQYKSSLDPKFWDSQFSFGDSWYLQVMSPRTLNCKIVTKSLTDHWTRAWWNFCAISSGSRCPLTQSFEVDKTKAEKKSRHRSTYFTNKLCFKYANINLYEFYVFLSPAKRAAGPHSAVGNVSGYRCVSDCRSRGREFDPGPVPYFRGDWSCNDLYGHSPPFRWFIQEGLLSVTSESMSTNYWLTACSSLPRKKCG